MAKPVAAITLFLAAWGGLSIRQYHNLLDPADPLCGNWGLADFRDVIYYPARAVLDGNNPYDAPTYMSEYPVGNVFPLYAPHLLLLFLPFALLPFAVSGALFWLLLVATYPVFAAVCLRSCGIRPLVHRVFFLAIFLLVSIPGRWAFDAGQLALLFSIGTVIALDGAASRPASAGLGLMIAALKPTYGVPLALLLLIQRKFKTVLIGTAVSVVAAAVIAAIIAAGSGWGSLPAMMDQNQALLEDQTAFHAAETHTRVDANVFLLQVLRLPAGRWLELAVFGLTLLVAAAALRGTGETRAATPAGAVILLAMTICCYHQAYDSVLLVLIPLAVFGPARGEWAHLSRGVQAAVAALSAVPLVNVTWTTTFSSMLRRIFHVSEVALEQWASIAAVVNSTACLSAFVLLTGALLAKGRGGQSGG